MTVLWLCIDCEEISNLVIDTLCCVHIQMVGASPEEVDEMGKEN